MGIINKFKLWVTARKLRNALIKYGLADPKSRSKTHVEVGPWGTYMYFEIFDDENVICEYCDVETGKHYFSDGDGKMCPRCRENHVKGELVEAQWIGLNDNH